MRGRSVFLRLHQMSGCIVFENSGPELNTEIELYFRVVRGFDKKTGFQSASCFGKCRRTTSRNSGRVVTRETCPRKSRAPGIPWAYEQANFLMRRVPRSTPNRLHTSS